MIANASANNTNNNVAQIESRFEANSIVTMNPNASANNSNIQIESRYEGCGEEGPLKSIFLAEFHPTTGPMIRCQTPSKGPDLLSKDVFDAISVYIIPKQQLARRTMTVNVLNQKICGYPIIIEDNKYKRNQFMFNLCFVCHPWSRTAQYEPALIKLSEFLVARELESQFLSKDEENKETLQYLLETVFSELNEKSCCDVQIRSNTLQLKVISSRQEPIVVHDYDVPVLMIDPSVCKYKWDLTTQQLFPYLNGIKHVARVAADADVETSLVRAAIQSLVFHRVVKLVPIFQYSNVYCVTPELRQLRERPAVREEVLRHIWSPETSLSETKPSFREIYEFVCSFGHGTTVRDLCVRFSPKERLGIDVCKLVTVLQLKKFMRRVHKYPVYVPPDTNGPIQANNVGCFTNSLSGSGPAGAAENFYDLFNGHRHYDEICCMTGLTSGQLDDVIENDPDVFVIRK